MNGVRHSKGHTVVVTALAMTYFWSFSVLNVNGAGPLNLRLILVDRAVTQDQGAWVIDYRLRNAARTGMIVAPDGLELKVKGWVSNSRVLSHAVPRWSSLTATPRVDPTAFSEVINTSDESQRCYEHLVISMWSEGQSRSNGGSAAKRIDPPRIMSWPTAGRASVPLLPISLGPDDKMYLRLRIEHQHVLYGDYDPLLGVRTIELNLGESFVRDVLPLDREQYLAQPKYTWSEPPKERCDTRHFVSGPDSLHLEADVQGHQSYRYQERPVRYNTRMKLRFWYLIAAGTEGECHIRLRQNKDTPLAWRQLHEAAFEEQLKMIGRWTRYECIFQTEPEATRLILEFKIVGEIDVGEMWIDDVSLEPLANTGPAGP